MGNKRTYQFGESRLTLEFGDITNSEAQVLVSSDDGYLTMSGGVSAAIHKAGGNAIALDAAKKIPATPGDVIITTAGALPAQYIFHAITMGREPSGKTPEEILTQVIRRSLQLVEVLNLRAIAFPAIGAGTARFSYARVATKMAEVIADDLMRRTKPIEVTVYLFDQTGQMQEFDFINFFEEFAARVPQVAQRETPEPQQTQDETPRDRIFISYSHKNKEWLERLQIMLKPLVRNNSFAIWDDTTIRAGAHWREEIDKALQCATVAVLLVSPDFLASDFIADHELPPLLKAAKNAGLTILWAYVSECLYEETEIKDYQAAHDISRPLDSLGAAEQNRELVRICQEIKKAVTRLS